MEHVSASTYPSTEVKTTGRFAASMSDRKTVLIVDDHFVVRKGLRDILASYDHLHVVGEAPDPSSALDLTEALQPDVILLDIRLPEASGVGLIGRLKDNCAQAKVIILTTFDHDEYLFGALREGADGYLLKTVTAEELEDAISRVIQGE